MLRVTMLVCTALLSHNVDARAITSASPKVKPKEKTETAKGWFNSPPALSKAACRALYVATAINPALSVWKDEYTGIAFRRLGRSAKGAGTVTEIYKALFYFARLKPRLLFVIGACLRALQVTTVIELVFDPSIGVGAGLNLLALCVSSKWPAPFVLGWAISKPCWRMLRGRPPTHDVRVPVRAMMWW